MVMMILLLLIGYSTLKSIPKNKWKWIFITGLVSFIPPFLFAYAQTEIDNIFSNAKDPYHDNMHKDHMQRVEHMRQLHEKRFGK